jgi:hypothetical protein
MLLAKRRLLLLLYDRIPLLPVGMLSLLLVRKKEEQNRIAMMNDLHERTINEGTIKAIRHQYR